jgi:hypothetical protein
MLPPFWRFPERSQGMVSLSIMAKYVYLRDRHYLVDEEGKVVIFDWLITNPPYSLFKPFLLRAMEVANNIVFLAPINHFVTKARLRMMKEEGFGFVKILSVPTPKEWPQSGFQLAAVHIQRGYTGLCDWVYGDQTAHLNLEDLKAQKDENS